MLQRNRPTILLIVLLALFAGQSSAQTYCTPSHGNANYYISSFSTSGGQKNINNTTVQPTSGVFYADYSESQFVKADPGDLVSWSISSSQYNTYKRIWVDWNRDGDFLDAGEEVYGANVRGSRELFANERSP